MQVPSILRGKSRTRLLQGIVIGAVASVVIGFSWGGWITSGAANKLAAEQANTAVVAALTPLCVEKFFQSGDAKANLLVLQKISTNWEQGAFLEKGGWATRPGAESSDYNLARACAEKLVEAKTANPVSRNYRSRLLRISKSVVGVFASSLNPLGGSQ